MKALVASLLAAVFMGTQTTPSSATISGRVLEAGTDRPVRRAIVTATGGGLPNGKSAVTDDDGRFVIARVPDGEFIVGVTRPGFLAASFGATRPGRPGTPVTVRAGVGRSDITIAMTHGSALAGVIRDASGDPAPGMRIEAIRIQHTSTGDRAAKLGEARADDRGEFRVYGLPAGDYVLAATPAMLTSGLGEIGVPSDAEVDAKLNRLRTRSTLPAPGTPNSGTPAPPPSRGYSSSAVFYPGVVSSSDAALIALGANESRESLDFATRFSRAATVDGSLVASRGIVLPQMQLEIQGSGAQLPVAGGSRGGPSIRMDNLAHTFQISNVPPGHYKLNARTLNTPGNTTQVMSSGGALPKIDTSGAVLWGTVEFDVVGEDVAGISLTIQQAPAVVGRLVPTADAAKPPVSLAGARIALEPVANSDRRSNGLSSPITTVATATGTFQMPSVIPGAYRVTATLPSGWWLRAATTGGVDVLDGVLTVGADGLTDLALSMSNQHSSIAGTLTAAGEPATEYFLVAFTADKTMWRAPSRRVRSMRPSTTGAFAVVDLPPGQYYLAALRDLDSTDLEDPAFLEMLIPSAALVTVTEGQKTVQDLRIGG